MVMSALCEKQTFGAAAETALFDQLISAPAQIERHGNAKGLRSLEVDD
jgi:hypothetical protein